MTEDFIALLQVHHYFRGLPEELLREILQQGHISLHAAGEMIHKANTPLHAIGFVLRGRVKAVRVDAQGHESLFRMIERGEQFGMMVGVLSEPVPVGVVALEQTTILNLDYEQAFAMTAIHQELRRLWLETFAESFRKHFLTNRGVRKPMLLAMIHLSGNTQSAAESLVARLHEVGETLVVFGEAASWRGLPGVQCRSLYENGKLLGTDEIRRQAAAWQGVDRIIFDVKAEIGLEALRRLMQLVDRALYFVTPDAKQDALRHLDDCFPAAQGWSEKISLAWLLSAKHPHAPRLPGLNGLVGRQFMLTSGPSRLPYGPSSSAGLERLVHDLRGIRIGLSLGGGAARGMSHLGVLQALEHHGIIVDMIAGTSAGAMTGVFYAAGLDCGHVMDAFATDLQPPWPIRYLPHSHQWNLLYKYRTGQFDPMLRKYLKDLHLEQLPLPCLTITVDLVSGNAVVRERGDAVDAILESINLPVISVPICRNGQALIDGGLVNNIPADVLVTMGCNFVIAVSVTTTIDHRFAGAQSGKATSPNFVQTLLRSLLVQNYNLNALGVRPADLVIAPDVSAFDLANFTKVKEMAVIGAAAAMEQVPRIHSLLTRLDPQLFNWAEGPSRRAVEGHRALLQKRPTKVTVSVEAPHQQNPLSA